MTTFTLEQMSKNYSCDDLCERCGVTVTVVEEFIDLGIIEPDNTAEDEYKFSTENYLRLRKALRIQRDLAVNPPGVALAMDLLDEVDALRRQLDNLTNMTLEK